MKKGPAKTGLSFWEIKESSFKKFETWKYI